MSERVPEHPRRGRRRRQFSAPWCRNHRQAGAARCFHYLTTACASIYLYEKNLESLS